MASEEYRNADVRWRYTDAYTAASTLIQLGTTTKGIG